MTTFLTFLSTQWQGILVFASLLLVAVLILQWVVWIFAKGRFQMGAGLAERQDLRFIVTELFVKVINDFRHLLALVLVTIFALALTYSLALVAFESTNRLDAVSTALQAVTSSLGGLIGAIIGYYFGEKAAEDVAAAARGAPGAGGAGKPPTTDVSGPPVQKVDEAEEQNAEPVRPAPRPPSPDEGQ